MPLSSFTSASSTILCRKASPQQNWGGILTYFDKNRVFVGLMMLGVFDDKIHRLRKDVNKIF